MRATSSWSILPASPGPVGACRLLRRTGLLLVLAVGVVGCGRGDESTNPGHGGGPPRWRISENLASGQSGLILHTRAPARCRLRFESTTGPSDAGAWRPLVAGQNVLVRWAFDRLPQDKIEDQPPRLAAEEGRSRPFAAEINCQYDDRVSNHRRLVFWARPTGRLKKLTALPPGRYEELPAEGSIELMTIVLSDLADGSAQLKRRGYETRVVLPGPLAEGDRVETARVFLDVAPAE